MPRLLILSQTFYPDPAVASVRVSQWARWLPELGWQPHVICRHAGYDATPAELAAAVHADVEVHRVGPRVAPPDARGGGGPPRGGLSGMARVLLERTTVPDVGIVSWKRLRDEVLDHARRIRPDVVLSTSPPLSIHWLARVVAAEVNAAWVADFRDPYTLDERFSPSGVLKPLRLLHRRYESAIYRDADLTVHAIPLQARWARRRYPHGRDRVRILPNGAPDTVAPAAPAAVIDEETIRLRAVGHIGPEAPGLLHETILELAGEGTSVDFKHAGAVPPTARRFAESAEPRMTFLGRVPHPEALRLIAEADVLLAYLSAERSRALGISSKLFEYFGTGKPILIVNPTRADRQLIRRVPWCETLTNPNSEELAAALRRLMDPNNQPKPEIWKPLAEKYDRRRQTGQLAEWLDEVIK